LAVRTRIKVCGITRPEDALAAVEAGVDGLGFIFVEKSPRNIDPAQAREIISRLPPFIDAVGVFVDAEATVVEEIAHYCRLTLVQLHGNEAPGYCRNLPFAVIKAFRVGVDFTKSALSPYDDYVRGFLLDTYHEDMAGGTGETFDWDLVRQLESARPVILAGGLNADNAAAAIERVRPYAVDVNSGVESEPGRKDIAELEQFIRQVRETDAKLS
jgi:phosphoribosylanthranilate isomerase